MDGTGIYTNRMLFGGKMKLLILLTILLFDADFRQTRTSAMLESPLVATGHMHYAAPDDIVWRYDGSETTSLPPQILSYIRSMVAEERAEADGWVEVTPLPKQVKRLFSSIRILMKNGAAHEVILTEPNGDQTKIEFINPQYTIQ